MCKRWRPDSIQVAVQPEVTVIAPESLVNVAVSYSTELTFQRCEVAPYRHGKLIEASCEDGSTWSLTGSPNLTAAALLGHVPQTGNCELGVIAQRHAPALSRDRRGGASSVHPYSPACSVRKTPPESRRHARDLCSSQQHS